MTNNKFILFRSKRRSRKKRASQGMTAAIILIAFIITAAGIAFVVLTMGSNFQQKLETIGTQGTDASSSAIRVEGGLVVGYRLNTVNISGYVFTLKMVLDTGLVDLGETSCEMSIIVSNNTEQTLTYDSDLDTVGELNGTDSNAYGYMFYNNDSDSILEPGEMVEVIINTIEAEIGAAPNEKVVILIITGVAMLKIEKTMPTGIEVGSNILK